MINAVSFGKRDNENNPTGGKWIGAGLGATWGGYQMYKGTRISKEMDVFLSTEAGKKINNCKDLESLKKFINASSLSAKTKKEYARGIKLAQWTNLDKQPGFVENYIATLKGPKKARALGVVIGIGFVTLVGLGLGAIVDHFRKHDEED